MSSIALAILKLMISSKFVGCSTGRSAGLAFQVFAGFVQIYGAGSKYRWRNVSLVDSVIASPLAPGIASVTAPDQA